MPLLLPSASGIPLPFQWQFIETFKSSFGFRTSRSLTNFSQQQIHFHSRNRRRPVSQTQREKVHSSLLRTVANPETIFTDTTMSGNSDSTRKPIFSLPLSPVAPIYHLSPDPLFPSPNSVLSLSHINKLKRKEAKLNKENARESDGKPNGKEKYPNDGKETPSSLRKSRIVRAEESGNGSAFTFITPLPIPFPYRFEKPSTQSQNSVQDNGGIDKKRKAVDPQEERDGSDESVKEGEAGGTATDSSPLDVEDLLASMEPSMDHVVPSSTTTSLKGYTSPLRQSTPPFGNPKLLSLSKGAWEDCLPYLDLGFNTKDPSDFDFDSAFGSKTSENLSLATKDVIKVLAGETVLGKMEEEYEDGTKEKGWAPWSMCYGGHQFGSWAGQLGDGRAISILSTLPPSQPTPRLLSSFGPNPAAIELQLKGAGRTPYSRFADGLAVTRSSIREFLGSEAMAALSIPTTRALSIIQLQEVMVQRERMEKAAIVCRIAPSWVRIGNFEILRFRQQWSSLRRLSFYLGKEIFRFSSAATSRLESESNTQAGSQFNDVDVKTESIEPKAKGTVGKVFWEVAMRNAKMLAGWQAYGFMHGVINTDNLSVLGLTIDYGPFAFMDVFDKNHICNHEDHSGRYRYSMQPSMIAWNLKRLADAIAEMLGWEISHPDQVLPENWADPVRPSSGPDASADQNKTVGAESQAKLSVAPQGGPGAGDSDSEGLTKEMREWKKLGLEEGDRVVEAMKKEFVRIYEEIMAKRLGISATTLTSNPTLLDELLTLLTDHNLDYHSTFRALSHFSSISSPKISTFIEKLVPEEMLPIWAKMSNPTFGESAGPATEARQKWMDWLKKYESLVENELKEKAKDQESSEEYLEKLRSERGEAMKYANPRFVLRQWVLEEVIESFKREGEDKGIEHLNRVLNLVTNPFESYGEDWFGNDEKIDDAPSQEERRLCGVGEELMRGFQCSCSS